MDVRQLRRRFLLAFAAASVACTSSAESGEPAARSDGPNTAEPDRSDRADSASVVETVPPGTGETGQTGETGVASTETAAAADETGPAPESETGVEGADTGAGAGIFDGVPERVDGELSMEPKSVATGMCWRTRCEPPQAELVQDGYPEPYSHCRLASSFSAQATTSRRGNGSNADDVCCYSHQRSCGGPMGGRPLRDADGLAVGLAEPGASIWRAQAQAEYVSIASFAVIVGELLALGASPDLIAVVLKAASDEARHAELLDRRNQSEREDRSEGKDRSDRNDRSRGFARVPTVVREPSWTRLAIEAVADGCVGETFAAQMAALAAERTVDPQRADALRKIAEDELRHAELAFVLLARARAAGVDESVIARGLALAASVDLDDDALGYGLVPRSERLAIHRRIRESVVEPVLRGVDRAGALST